MRDNELDTACVHLCTLECLIESYSLLHICSHLCPAVLRGVKQVELVMLE